MAKFEEPEEDYDENDEGVDDEEDDEPSFEENLVFVIMPFHGEDSDEAYSAIKGACANIGLNAKRVSEARNSL